MFLEKIEARKRIHFAAETVLDQPRSRGFGPALFSFIVRCLRWVNLFNPGHRDGPQAAAV
jgi:hypothetical protein